MSDSTLAKSYKYMGKWAIAAEVISVIAIAFAFIYAFAEYGNLPEQVPSHFGADGVADDYSGKSFVWVLPILMVFLYGILTMIFFIDPKHLNYPYEIKTDNKEAQIGLAYGLIQWLKLIILVFLAYGVYEMIGLAKSPDADIFPPWSLWLFLALIFGSIIIYLILAMKRK